MFLLLWKLNVPRSPIAPTDRPLYAAPCAWAASSMIVSPCLAPSALKASMSAGRPARCTTTIALVRSVIAASAATGSRRCVSRSTSAKTGTAPTNSAAEAVAMNVYGGTITSSPIPTPAARSATAIASVPLARQIACPACWYSANSSWNVATTSPLVLPHFPEFSTSSSAFASSSPYSGHSGIPDIMV